MSQDTRIGTEIAGYRIESLLGRGGMSVVYLATQSFPRRKVALKLLAPEIASEQGFRERFIRESNAAASLDHPNVIPIYGAGEEQGVLWIAMRYVEGTDLDHLIREDGALPPERTVHILDQVASALDAAHDIGLVHRDVKPGNILLTKRDHAYLTDFGITKRRDAVTAFTKTGDFLGSVDYAAPEQIKGEPVDPRADVYSLGCVTYECLTGEPPFPREAEIAVLYAHLEDPPPHPTTARPGLPEAVDEVVAKAMAKSPDRRYSTAPELTRALSDALRVGLGTEREAVAQRAPAPARRRRALLGVTAVVVAAMVAVIAALLIARGGGSPASTGERTGVSPSGSTASTSPAMLRGFTGVARLDPESGKVADKVPLTLPPVTTLSTLLPRALLAGEGAIWVVRGGSSGQVMKLNPETGAESDRVTLPRSPSGSTETAEFFAAGQSSLWALTLEGRQDRSALLRMDPATDDIVAAIEIGLGARGVAVGPEGVWVVQADGTLTEIDSGTNRRARTIEAGRQANGIALAGGAVWVADNLAGVVYRVDPETEDVRTIDLHGGADGIVADSTGVWVMSRATGTVVRIDPESGDLGEQIRVGADPTVITAGAGYIWVSDPTEGSIYRIDPRSGEAIPFPVARDPGPTGISVGEGGVWVSVG